MLRWMEGDAFYRPNNNREGPVSFTPTEPPTGPPNFFVVVSRDETKKGINKTAYTHNDEKKKEKEESTGIRMRRGIVCVCVCV